MIQMIGGDGYGKLTQNAGTRIRRLLGGVGGLFTHLLNMRYTDSGTAHTLTIMRGASRAKTTAAVAAAGTSVVVDTALTDGDANAIAANDCLGIRLDNGTWHFSTVSAWDSTTKTITLNTAVPTGRSILKGAAVVCYGVAGDTYHSNQQFTGGSGASATNFPPANTPDVSLVRASYPGEPLLFDSDNATNAGTLNNIEVGYAKR